MFPLLTSINSPIDLRQLDREQLTILADELRAFLIESVSQTGGHLASNLGVVELTIALHYVFNTPDDRLVWDVGHQTYPHKILTGRREQMAKLRKENGIAGFPRRSESEYDTFGTGHSSTSISAALGMAIAAKHAGLDRHSVAIIGDGAMTAVPFTRGWFPEQPRSQNLTKALLPTVPVPRFCKVPVTVVVARSGGASKSKRIMSSFFIV